MKCSLCQQEVGRAIPVEIVTGRLLGTKTSGRTTTKTYGDFQPLSLSFCETCWRVLNAREERRMAGNGLLILIFAPVALIFVPLIPNGGLRTVVLVAAGLLFLFGLIVTVSGLAKRRHPTDWSARHFDEKTTPDEYFRLFNPILTNLVYEFRGKEIHYWKRSEWEQWQKVKFRSNTEMHLSSDPTWIKDDNQDKLRASILKDVQAGRLEKALARCDDNFLSGIIQNLEGEIVEKLGRTDEARCYYHIALLHHPGLAEAQQNLARLGQGK